MAEAQVAARQKHEDAGIDTRRATRFALGVAALVAAAMLVNAGITAWRGSAAGSRAEHPAPAMEPPVPRLEPDPQSDMATYAREQRARLDGYGWVDSGAGIAHIPIGRAVELYVSRAARAGTPERRAPAGAPAAAGKAAR